MCVPGGDGCGGVRAEWRGGVCVPGDDGCVRWRRRGVCAE
jgi:hypothetical protein